VAVAAGLNVTFLADVDAGVGVDFLLNALADVDVAVQTAIDASVDVSAVVDVGVDVDVAVSAGVATQVEIRDEIVYPTPSPTTEPTSSPVTLSPNATPSPTNDPNCVCVQNYAPYCCDATEEYNNECYAECDGYDVSVDSCVAGECDLESEDPDDPTNGSGAGKVTLLAVVGMVLMMVSMN